MQKNTLAQSEKLRRLAQTAMLFAVCVVLMFVEGMIPPIPTLPPGVKLGLANIVVMYTLFFLGTRQAFAVLLLKSGFVLLTRGIVAFGMSFCGGLLSVFVLILLFRLKKINISYIIASVLSAIAHNMGQLIISSLILKTATVFYYSPVLLISGVVMGAVTGMTLRVLLPAVNRLRLFKN